MKFQNFSLIFTPKKANKYLQFKRRKCPTREGSDLIPIYYIPWLNLNHHVMGTNIVKLHFRQL